MENEDVLRLRAQIWFGCVLASLGLTLFVLALFGLAVQFQHNLGVHLMDVKRGVDNPVLLLVPLLTISGIACTLIGLSALAGARNTVRVRSHGLLGKAKIVSATPTQVEVRGLHLLQIELLVELSGLEPYTASTRAAPAQPGVSIEPGLEMPVRVDPKDEQRILFV
jgi:hypothetical protein